MTVDDLFKMIKPTFTLMGFWSKLHSFFYELESSMVGPLPEEGRISHNINVLLDSMDLIPASEWHDFCRETLHTSYSAVALSWCKDAELSQVWEGWEASGFPLKPLPEFERPARFINPALMPQTNKLTGMLEAFNDKYPDSQTTYSLAICAAIAALKEPLDFDMSAEQMAKATPQIASFLKSRILQKPDRKAEENALIEVWTKTVKGTEFDVWEDA